MKVLMRAMQQAENKVRNEKLDVSNEDGQAFFLPALVVISNISFQRKIDLDRVKRAAQDHRDRSGETQSKKKMPTIKSVKRRLRRALRRLAVIARKTRSDRRNTEQGLCS